MSAEELAWLGQVGCASGVAELLHTYLGQGVLELGLS